jgi:hypothetical protein
MEEPENMTSISTGKTGTYYLQNSIYITYVRTYVLYLTTYVSLKNKNKTSPKHFSQNVKGGFFLIEV